MKRNTNNPPSKINGKANPEYTKWYWQQRKISVTKTCECGCGWVLSKEKSRFKKGHYLHEGNRREEFVLKRITLGQDPIVRKFRSDVLLKKKESHFSAKPWRIISPSNVTYQFSNLNHFVRTHKHLFHPDDVAQKTTKKGEPYWSASRGIQALSPRKKKPCGSWKGWRIDSQQERLFHEGKTLLEDITPPRASSSTTQETPRP